MTNALYRLLDNRWLVLVQKQVDGQYGAACFKPYTGMKGVFGVFEAGLDEAGKPSLTEVDPGKPNQRASGATPEEAIANLADKVLGLSAVTESES